MFKFYYQLKCVLSFEGYKLIHVTIRGEKQNIESNNNKKLLIPKIRILRILKQCFFFLYQIKLLFYKCYRFIKDLISIR